jgi:hypothetical protein
LDVRNISGAWRAEHSCPKRYPSSSEVLAQAKNGDEQFWKEKYHASNRKAQHAVINSLVFFFLKGGRGEEGIFSLVPNMFPWGFIIFPRGSIKFSNSSQIYSPRCSQ